MSLIGRLMGVLVPRLRTPGQPPEDGAAVYFSTLGDRLRYLLFDGSDRWLVDSSHRGAQGGVDPMPVISTSAPTVNDDTTKGYVQGQRWLYTSGPTWYYAYSVAAGAADWRALLSGSSTVAIVVPDDASAADLTVSVEATLV